MTSELVTNSSCLKFTDLSVPLVITKVKGQVDIVKRFKGEISLFTATLLWGTCFVFQKQGMDFIGPYTLGAFRFLIGALFLLPVIPLYNKFLPVTKPNAYNRASQKGLIRSGILCGIVLFFAASLQQIGLLYTTAGKAGFLTSMEIVMVAVFSIILTRQIQKNVLAGVFLAVLGTYLLCLFGKGFSLNKGDAYEISATIFWAMQIMLLDCYAKRYHIIKLSIIQFLTTGILSLFGMLLFETVTLQSIIAGIIPILYTAIIEVAIAYTLQSFGQMYTKPVIASVILSLESVVAVLCSALFLGEQLTWIQISGCVLMLLAVSITQIEGSSKLS